MKKPLLCVVLMLMANCIFTQDNYYHSDTSKYYSFHINYWSNLHHFLWLEAFLNKDVDSTIIRQNLPEAARSQLNTALAYYQTGPASEDLRESDYMTAFKLWIHRQPKTIDTVPEEFQEHMAVLTEISDVYEKYFWPEHRAACQQVLADHMGLILKTEEEFVERITKLTRQFWQFEKLNVDITYVAKATKWNLRNRPYTSLFPTHVVMNALGENNVKGNWLELLYHESAHHLILGRSYFVGGTIRDLTEVMQIKPPRQLGHAYLFYFTGQLTKELLAKNNIDYPLIYMERNRVFFRYFPYLDKHLKAYMAREITLVEATERIIGGLRK